MATKPNLTQVNLHLEPEAVALLDAIIEKIGFNPARQKVAKMIFANALAAYAKAHGVTVPGGAVVAVPKPAKATKVADAKPAASVMPKTPKSDTAKTIAKNVAKLAKPAKARKVIGAATPVEAPANVDQTAA